MKPRTIWVIASAISLLLVAPIAAQECSIQTLTGTYAFRGIGQSFVGGPPYPIETPSDPAHGILPLHATGAFLAGSHVGVLTIHPDGTIQTRSWVAMGPYRTDPAGLEAPASITSIGLEKAADGTILGCGGTLQYPGLPGAPDTVDKFIAWDNGSEVRFTHLNGNSPTSIFVGKRITRSVDAGSRCEAQPITGKYVATCHGSLFYMNATTTLSTTAMFHLSVVRGQVVGNMFNRIASLSNLIPVSGEMEMGTDCTGTGYLDLPGLLPPGAKMRYSFVTYDNGKGGFLMPLEIEFANSTRVPYSSPMSCQLEKAEP